MNSHFKGSCLPMSSDFPFSKGNLKNKSSCILMQQGSLSLSLGRINCNSWEIRNTTTNYNCFQQTSLPIQPSTLNTVIYVYILFVGYLDALLFWTNQNLSPSRSQAPTQKKKKGVDLKPFVPPSLLALEATLHFFFP